MPPKTASRPSPSSRDRPSGGGFTLIEVMVALLIATIGLLGTVAFQQTLLNATANANDGQVASQLCAKAAEELNTRQTQASPFVDALGPLASGEWSDPLFLDASGRPSDTQSPSNRWRLRSRVTDVGVGQPYQISVEVSYSLGGDNPKVARLDIERRKTW